MTRPGTGVLHTTAFLVLLAWSALFLSHDFDADFPPRSDDSFYLLEGKNFAQGTGYRNTASPFGGQVFVDPSAFPLLLSLYWTFAHPHVLVLKLFLAGLLILGVWLSFIWMKRMVGPVESFLVALGFAATPFFLMIGTSALSETLYVPILYAGILLTVKAAKQHYRGRTGWAALICWIVLARTRMVGLAFLAVYLITLLLNREWRKGAAGVLLIGLWLAIERIVAAAPTTSAQAATGYLPYLLSEHPVLNSPAQALTQLAQQYLHNLWSFAGSIYAQTIFPWFYAFVEMNRIKRVVVLLVFVNACWGGWVLWRQYRDLRPVIIGLLVSLIPVFSWPRTGTIFRYLFPYFPFLVLAMLLPLRQAVARSRRRLVAFLPIVMLAAIVVNQGVTTLGRPESDPFLAGKEDLCVVHEFIARSAEKPAMILSPQYVYTYLKTDIHAVDNKQEKDIARYLVEKPETSVWGVFDERQESWLLPLAARGGLRTDGSPLFRQGRYVLYQMTETKREGVTDSSGNATGTPARTRSPDFVRR